MKFDILNRFSNAIIFVAEIECRDEAIHSTKLGLAVKAAVNARANLAGADLACADLTDANLAGADLTDANLADANLARASLAGAYLACADLTGADLTDANLARANLACADLTGANLTGANLADANLACANLTGTNLAGANLADANLARANLTGTKNAKLVVAKTRILPAGDLIGWKKCNDDVIVKLLVPAAAKRSHAFGRKCRAEYVDVVEIVGAEIGVTNAHGPRTEYRTGARVTADSFNDDWTNECSNGIHFFVTREEAEAYV